MQQNFIHLEWDTKLFGFGVGRIIQAELDEAEFSNTLETMRNNGCRLAYWQTPVGARVASRIARAHGGFLADEKVTYARELGGMPEARAASAYAVLPYPAATPDAALTELALQSGKYSRFRQDPRFPGELCDRLYTYWITRSVSGEIAWKVLVVREHNDLLGFITLGAKNGRGDIGLLAVAEQARGKGIGTALVTEADRHFAERGYTQAQVVTQRVNYGACRLYESCGYLIEKVENVFHFWL